MFISLICTEVQICTLLSHGPKSLQLAVFIFVLYAVHILRLFLIVAKIAMKYSLSSEKWYLHLLQLYIRKGLTSLLFDAGVDHGVCAGVSA